MLEKVLNFHEFCGCYSFHSLIWSSKNEPQAFEALWEFLLKDFNITNNKWLNVMYGLRRLWIPTFFKDIPMSGLM